MQENNQNIPENENIDVEGLNFDVDTETLTAKEARKLLKQYIEREKDLAAQAKQVAERVAGLKAEAAEFKNKWMRTAAEFDNYKKRTAQSCLKGIEDGKNQIIIKVLPIGDNLERAAAMPIDEKTKEGINLLIRSFKEMLEKEGIEEINPKGEPFDPNFHEAVMQCEGGEGQESGTVSEVFLKGYKSDGRIIRYAQVKVVS